MIWRIVLALLFASFASGIGLVVLLQFQPLAGALWALALGASFLWWHLRPARPRRRARVRMRMPRGEPRHMVVASVATLLVAIGVVGLIELVFSPLDDMDVAYLDRMARYQQIPGGWVALTIFVALVVPVIEEFCFRGHIQHAIERRLAPWLAILITAALFTVVHISPAHSSLLMVPLVLGVGMGVATVLFQSIWVAVIIHAIWNAVMSVQSLMDHDADVAMDPTGLLSASLIPLALGVVGWLLVLRNGRYRALLAPPTNAEREDAGPGPAAAAYQTPKPDPPPGPPPPGRPPGER